MNKELRKYSILSIQNDRNYSYKFDEKYVDNANGNYHVGITGKAVNGDEDDEDENDEDDEDDLNDKDDEDNDDGDVENDDDKEDND